MAFVYKTKDKKIRYWNLDKFDKILEIIYDRLPIEKLTFYNEGKNMFLYAN